MAKYTFFLGSVSRHQFSCFQQNSSSFDEKSSLYVRVYFIYCTIVAYLQCKISYHIFRSCLRNDKLFLNSILKTLDTLED